MPDNQHWPQIEALFDAAWELPAGERKAWLLAQAVGEDVRATVLRMLEAPGFLDGCVAEEGDVPGAMPRLTTGSRVGVWRVLGPLGRGGMGEVFEVERADGQFEQRAALKCIAHASIAAWTRFQNERQILARLDHPGIARMIDGGLLDDGQPYMVMEYVQDGLPIDRWCRAPEVGLRQKVGLLLQACEAVSHAHARLVIHRDIKPSNLLVDPRGRVRLIDFGVARLAGDADKCGRAPMSPGYAAPEQIEGREVGTAADLHALAAVLYRLVSGHAPHGAEAPGTVELALRAAAGRVPRLREARVPVRSRADRALLADLDAILARALDADPTRRPASVELFAEDLSRALEALPVQARAHERRYRAGRFAWRYRWAIGTVAGIIIALSAGLALALWQAREAALQRDVALGEQSRLEAVQQAVFHMFRSAGEMRGGEASAADVLAASAQRVVDGYARDPAAAAPVLHALGELYFLMTDYAAAEPLLRRLAEADPATIDPALIAAGRYDLAQVRLRNGDAEGAQALLAQARGFWQADPERWASRIIDSRLLEAQLLQRSGEAEAAVAVLREGLAARIAHSGASHRETGVFHNNLGVALFGLGRHEEARTAFAAARGVWQAIGLADSPDSLNTLNNWGAAELAAGATATAEPLLRDAVALRRRLFGPSAATAALLNNYGKLLLQTGRAVEALPLLVEAAAMGAQYAGYGSMHHVAALSGVADATLALGEIAQARTQAQVALDAADATLGAGHPGAAAPRLSLARIALAGKDVALARVWLAQAEGIGQSAGPAGARILAQAGQLRATMPADPTVPATATPAP